MRKLLLGAAALLAMSGPTMPADLGLSAHKAPPAPPWSWTGCYGGGHTGWLQDSQEWTNRTPGGAFDNQWLGGHRTVNALLGVQAGCDYQFAGGFVVGVQGTFLGTDINGLSQDPHNGVRQTTTPFLPVGFTNNVFGGGSIGVRTRYLESVTGRLGWAGWSPQTLFYVRGGGAWIDTQLDMRASAVGFPGFGTFPAARIFDTKYSGWTVGGGFEWMIFNNWSAFVEYNFYDFKNKTLFAVGGTPRIGPGINIQGRTLASDVTISTVSIGVNYRFNWANPVVARY